MQILYPESKEYIRCAVEYMPVEMHDTESKVTLCGKVTY